MERYTDGLRNVTPKKLQYAFELLNGHNKELMIIPGASHVDLYDNFDAIPFDKLQSFFAGSLR